MLCGRAFATLRRTSRNLQVPSSKRHPYLPQCFGAGLYSASCCGVKKSLFFLMSSIEKANRPGKILSAGVGFIAV